jgi:FkbM family methyltransferase
MRMDLPPPLDEIRRHVPGQRLAMVFDVGANEGQSCLGYARALPEATVHAFEPMMSTYMRLAANVAGNPRIRLHNLALGEENGILRMAVAATSSMNRVTTGAGPAEEVPGVTLETFCRARGIGHIDFLKIDTEGHDLSVLRGCGAMLAEIDFIQCEASANRYNRFHNAYADIFDFLSDRGFHLFQITGQTWEWGGGGKPVLRRFDPVFVNARVVGPLAGVTVA